MGRPNTLKGRGRGWGGLPSNFNPFPFPTYKHPLTNKSLDEKIKSFFERIFLCRGFLWYNSIKK
jgi:hypothetical protein